MKELEELESQSEYFDAGDKKKVNERNSRLGREKENEQNFIKTIMSLPEGRKWIYNLLEICKVFGNPVILGDPYATHFNIGEQNVGKKLLQDINDCASEQYTLMIKEANDRRDNEIRKNHTAKKN